VLIQLLRRTVPPYRGQVMLVVLLQTIQTVAMLYLPTLNADIIDQGVVRGDTAYILRTGGVMLLISLVQVVCAVVAVYYGANAAMAIGRDIRSAIFHRVQGFSAREVGSFGAPSLITRSTNDVQQVQMLTLLTFTMMVTAPIMCVGGIAMAIHVDAPLSSLLLVIVPALVLLVTLIIRQMRPLFRQMQDRLDEINRVMREQITGIRVIRAFVRDTSERQRFSVANQSAMDVGLGVGRWMALMPPTVMLVINVSSVAVIWFGAHRVDSGGMQIGGLTAFLSYLMQILMAVMMATFMFVMLPRAEVSAERIEEVLSTEPSVVIADHPVRDVVQHGVLELRDVGFGYPGAEEPVLTGISLLARPGEVTAVIGSTGSGKTTLVNLIARLMDATAGAVLVDGIDVRQLAPSALVRAIGLVPQRGYLFSGTIATNLRYGNQDATDEDLWDALTVAQARDFVERLPDGLDSPIAQGGSNVSGGQRQRLAIARALVHRPDIYIFDDAFSALDYATDARLRAALAPRVREATVLIVAQRVSTIRDADRIVVLEHGRVVGTGTHLELLDSNQTYREIVLSQLTEAEAVA
jgi:ATP-binding cassette, subfamily B, multidrug efflux pump